MKIDLDYVDGQSFCRKNYVTRKHLCLAPDGRCDRYGLSRFLLHKTFARIIV